MAGFCTWIIGDFVCPSKVAKKRRNQEMKKKKSAVSFDIIFRDKTLFWSTSVVGWRGTYFLSKSLGSLFRGWKKYESSIQKADFFEYSISCEEQTKSFKKSQNFFRISDYPKLLKSIIINFRLNSLLILLVKIHMPFGVLIKYFTEGVFFAC